MMNVSRELSRRLFAPYSLKYISCYRHYESISENQILPPQHMKKRNTEIIPLKPVIPSHVKDRLVPRTLEEFAAYLNFQSPKDSKILKVAVIGEPNAGKSSLINSIIKWKLCPISSKPQTTISNEKAVWTADNTQIIFTDSPGAVTYSYGKKTKVDLKVLKAPDKCLEDADLIAVVHDGANSYNQVNLTHPVLRLLCLYPTKPSILIINKTDQYEGPHREQSIISHLTMGQINNKEFKIKKKRKRLTDEEHLREAVKEATNVKQNSPGKKDIDELTSHIDKSLVGQFSDPVEYDPYASKDAIVENESSDISKISFEDIYSGKVKLSEAQIKQFTHIRRGWPKFQQVFLVSARTRRNMPMLKKFLLDMAKPGEWMFSQKMITDQTPEEIICKTTRAICLIYLSHNLPYLMSFELVSCQYDESGTLRVSVKLHCKKAHHVSRVLGRKGDVIKVISRKAEQELQNIFRTEVVLNLNLESKEKPLSQRLAS